MGDCTLYRTDPQLLMLLYYTITPPWRNNPPGLDSHRPAPFRKDFLLKALHHQQQVFRVARCLFFVVLFYLFQPSQLIERPVCRLPFGQLISIGRGSSSWCWRLFGFDLMLPAVAEALSTHRRVHSFFPSYPVRYRDPANGTVRDRDNNCLFIPLYFFILSSVYLR